MSAGSIYQRADTPELLAEVDRVAAEYPKIQDARPVLSRIAIRERAPLIALVERYLKTQPEQFYTCGRCGEEVREEAIVSGTCLDCIQSTYTELFNDSLGG